jgi:hypothetical protein
MTPVVVLAEADIARSPEDVFDYCSDVRHEPEWNRMMRRADKLTDGAVGVGHPLRNPVRKRPPMVMKCVQYELPTAWFLRSARSGLTSLADSNVPPRMVRGAKVPGRPGQIRARPVARSASARVGLTVVIPTRGASPGRTVVDGLDVIARNVTDPADA